MNRKLTLSLDESIIERAKIYAHKNKESLSKIVENYFRIVTSKSNNQKEEISPLVKELIGSINVPDDFDYETAKQDYLKEKYLHD
jgi:hypothetical protein